MVPRSSGKRKFWPPPLDEIRVALVHQHPGAREPLDFRHRAHVIPVPVSREQQFDVRELEAQ
jgi:hypothetical protein